jgi:hypothetical protein
VRHRRFNSHWAIISDYARKPNLLGPLIELHSKFDQAKERLELNLLGFLVEPISNLDQMKEGRKRSLWNPLVQCVWNPLKVNKGENLNYYNPPPPQEPVSNKDHKKEQKPPCSSNLVWNIYEKKEGRKPNKLCFLVETVSNVY